MVAMMVAAANAVAVKAVVVKFGNCSLVVDRIGRWREEVEDDEEDAAATVVAVVRRAEGEKMVAMGS